MTQTFDYQVPRVANSRLRETVCRHASRNGGGLLFMAIFFAVAAWLSTSGRGLTLVGLSFAFAGLWHMSWGIFHVIAAVKIVRPHPFWEKAIVTGAAIQAAAVASCSVIAAWALVISSSPGVALLLLLGYAAIYLIAFVRLARLAAKLRKEG